MSSRPSYTLPWISVTPTAHQGHHTNEAGFLCVYWIRVHQWLRCRCPSSYQQQRRYSHRMQVTLTKNSLRMFSRTHSKTFGGRLRPVKLILGMSYPECQTRAAESSSIAVHIPTVTLSITVSYIVLFSFPYLSLAILEY